MRQSVIKSLKRVVIAGLSLVVFATYGSNPALAGGGKGYYYNSHNSYHGYYKDKHYRSYKGHRGYNYYGGHSRHRHSDGRLVTGLVIGAVAATALYSASRRDHHHTQSTPVYVAPPPQNNWVAPQARYQPVAQSSCLQEREYTTTITVGNETVPAYGTACLQPDGSWQMGPPQPVR